MPKFNLKSNYKLKTKAICLNPNDNIIISLGNLPAGHYLSEFKITIEKNTLKSEALEWSITRGARSGRVAWQFIQDLAGRKKIKILN